MPLPRKIRERVAPVMSVVFSLFFLVCVVCLTVIRQRRRSLRPYMDLARALCDPESWKVTFLVRMVVLKGRVGGFPVRYSVLGNPHGASLAVSHLLLLCPVGLNLRVYAESEPASGPATIRSELENLQRLEGFRSLILTPASSPLPGKMLSRPLGFPYDPGILLSKLGPGVFDPAAIRRDIDLLVALCSKSSV